MKIYIPLIFLINNIYSQPLEITKNVAQETLNYDDYYETYKFTEKYTDLDSKILKQKEIELENKLNKVSKFTQKFQKLLSDENTDEMDKSDQVEIKNYDNYYDTYEDPEIISKLDSEIEKQKQLELESKLKNVYEFSGEVQKFVQGETNRKDDFLGEKITEDDYGNYYGSYKVDYGTYVNTDESKVDYYGDGEENTEFFNLFNGEKEEGNSGDYGSDNVIDLTSDSYEYYSTDYYGNYTQYNTTNYDQHDGYNYDGYNNVDYYSQYLSESTVSEEDARKQLEIMSDEQYEKNFKIFMEYFTTNNSSDYQTENMSPIEDDYDNYYDSYSNESDEKDDDRETDPDFVPNFEEVEYEISSGLLNDEMEISDQEVSDIKKSAEKSLEYSEYYENYYNNESEKDSTLSSR